MNSMKMLFDENRLSGFKSYTGRFVDRLKKYDYTDPMQIGAAGVHTVSQFFGLDPATRDLGRIMDGDTSPVPHLEGLMPRTREDTLGAIKDLYHRKFFSALTKVINIVGDVAADGADMLAGVNK